MKLKYTNLPLKSTGPGTQPLLLLFISYVTPTAVKVYMFLQRFKPQILPVPLEPIAIVVHGSPFLVIVREYCRTHLTEDPAVERFTLNDWKSSLAITLIAGAGGGPRTQDKHITNCTTHKFGKHVMVITKSNKLSLAKLQPTLQQ